MPSYAMAAGTPRSSPIRRTAGPRVRSSPSTISLPQWVNSARGALAQAEGVIGVGVGEHDRVGSYLVERGRVPTVPARTGTDRTARAEDRELHEAPTWGYASPRTVVAPSSARYVTRASRTMA